MKKYLFSMLTVMAMAVTASAQDSDLSAMTDAIYVESATVPAGSQQTLSVKMKNSIEAQTIQFDLYLPEGMAFVANEDGEWMTASKERINKFNYFESAIQADGALRLLAQATTTNIVEGDGEIATFIVSADAAMTLGDYPIVVKDILIVSKDNDTKKVDEVTTTVTIGAPADTRTVLDETSTSVPEAATDVDVRVKRTIKADEWSTICLPFAMTETQVKAVFGDDVQLADFTGAESEFDDADNVVGIKVSFSNVTAIEANHPYIIKVSAPVTEFTLDGVDIVADEDEAYIEFDNGKSGSRRVVYSGFYGTYHAGTVLDELTLFLSDNKFWYSTGLTKMKSFRAYFAFLDVLTEVEENYSSRISMTITDETNGIRGITDSESRMTNGVFDLQGRQIVNRKSVNSKLQKGLYIVNGKKVVK